MNSDLLPHLETFIKAAEAGSFTAAARALGLTQAAVSQRIGTLERSLGGQLFLRQGGHVQLTAAGQRLHDYALRILALHHEARQEITGLAVPVVGDLNLAASSIPGEHFLPTLLATFRQRYPHVQVRATVTDSLLVLDQVEHGQASLGLVGRKDAQPHLEFRSFASDRMQLVVPTAHPWQRSKQVTLQQLCQQPLILRESGSGSRWCLEQALASVGKSVKDLHIALELGSNEAIKEAVQQGVGLAILSTHAVQKQLQAGHLHAVPIPDLALERELFVVWDRRRVLSIPARLFLDLLGPSSVPEQ
jgi:DNA-binding transcriptional LysR family regulator